jgi:hypothetical protein
MKLAKSVNALENVEADVHIANHGSIILFYPRTTEASDWAASNLPEDCPRFGSAYAVESRFAVDIAEGMAADGLVLRTMGM